MNSKLISFRFSVKSKRIPASEKQIFRVFVDSNVFIICREGKEKDCLKKTNIIKIFSNGCDWRMLEGVPKTIG